MNTKTIRGLAMAAVLCAALAAAPGVFAAEEGSGSEKAAAGDVYPLDVCPVSGEKLGSMGDPIIKVFDGREIRFCCKGCPDKFAADPAKYLAKVDAALIELQEDVYPVKTCPISGEELGGMGDPINIIHNNRLVQLCCKGCIKKFNANPDEHMAALDAAVTAQQKDSYPIELCLVSGDKLGADPDEEVNFVLANRFFHLCCKGCVKDIKKTPAVFISMLDDARAGKKLALPEGSHSE